MSSNLARLVVVKTPMQQLQERVLQLELSNLAQQDLVYQTFEMVGKQTGNLHTRVMELEQRVLDLGLKRVRDTQRIENLETSVWFLKTLMLLMTVWIFCVMVLMRLDFEESVSDG
jgi:hypothetical protein